MHRPNSSERKKHSFRNDENSLTAAAAWSPLVGLGEITKMAADSSERIKSGLDVGCEACTSSWVCVCVCRCYTTFSIITFLSIFLLSLLLLVEKMLKHEWHSKEEMGRNRHVFFFYLFARIRTRCESTRNADEKSHKNFIFFFIATLGKFTPLTLVLISSSELADCLIIPLSACVSSDDSNILYFTLLTRAANSRSAFTRARAN